MTTQYKEGQIIEKWGGKRVFQKGGFTFYDPDILKRTSFKELLEDKNNVRDIYKLALVMGGHYISGVHGYRDNYNR